MVIEMDESRGAWDSPMKKMRWWITHGVLIISSLLLGCEGEVYIQVPVPDPIDQWFDKTLSAEGTLQFTALPIDEEHLIRTYPLGSMGSHTFPTDHIYLEYTELEGETEVPVYAPSSARILHIEDGGAPYNDNSVHLSVTRDISYVLGHLFMSPDLTIGDYVEAGVQLGTCVPGSNLDLLVLDRNDGMNTCDNAKYPITTPYAKDPFPYFTEELYQTLQETVIPQTPRKSLDTVAMADAEEHDASMDEEHVSSYLDTMTEEEAIYEHMPDGRDEAFVRHYAGLDTEFRATDGTFEYDEEGFLQGNWFSLESDGLWHEGIAFAYDAWFPQQPRISHVEAYGPGTITQGRFAVRLDQIGYIPFDEVSSGDTILYTLYSVDDINWHGVPKALPTGLLKVCMEDDTAITVEIFSSTEQENPEFTSYARIFHR